MRRLLSRPRIREPARPAEPRPPGRGPQGTAILGGLIINKTKTGSDTAAITT